MREKDLQVLRYDGVKKREKMTVADWNIILLTAIVLISIGLVSWAAWLEG